METMEKPESATPQRPAKKYKFNYSPLACVLFGLGLALSVAGIGVTTWQFLGFLGGDISSVYEWMKYILLYIASVLLAVILVSMLIRSQYVLTDKQLILQFGFIKTKHDLKTIYSVHLFKGSGKLAVYFDDFKTKYVIIVVKERWYDDFVHSLLERNERIAFSFSTQEEEDEAKKKK